MLFYGQGVGLKSSITVDTAFRKDLTLQGCTNYPLRGSACTPISLSLYPLQAPIEELSQEIQNAIVPLTNNAQFRVAHGESTSNSKAGRSRTGLYRMTQVWIVGSPHTGAGSSAGQVGPIGYSIPLDRFVLKSTGS